MESIQAHEQAGPGKYERVRDDQARRNALATQYAPLVRLLANRVAMRLPPSVAVDDLVGAGNVGLLDAIDKFDPRKDVQLKTYAEFRIRGAILDELRSMDWLPRSVRKTARHIERAASEVERRVSRPADGPEIAEELGVDLDTYYDMTGLARDVDVLSLDEVVENHGNDAVCRRSYESLISGDDNPFDHVLTHQLKQALAKEIKALAERDQLVISLYYHEGLTLREIGEVIGLTESRVSQIHSKAVKKLRSKFKSYLAT
jgi:RNA polymerase sigma factor for flagellar operon FliA